LIVSFSDIRRRVKIFLFVQINPDVARAVENGGSAILENKDSHSSVMAGLVPAISIHVAIPCRVNRDCRDKRGNDGRSWSDFSNSASLS
jgi:hypothetical protein